jgi:putative phosphotransacetylase
MRPTEAELIRKVTEEVTRRMLAGGPGLGPLAATQSARFVPIGISARHVHLSPAQIEHLFGAGAQLTPFKPLSQPGQFAAEQTVTVVGPNGRTLERVRILGPSRQETQVELSQTDCHHLGVNAPVRASGDHRETPGILLIGPMGHLVPEKGVIRANRHLHLSPSEAAEFHLKPNQVISVRLSGDRPCILEGVQVRVAENFRCDLHLDTDDGNAAGVRTGDRAQLLILPPMDLA